VFFAASAPVVWFRNRNPVAGVATLFGALGFLLALVVSFALAGVTERYETDFATLLMISGVLMWLYFAATVRRGRRTVVAVGALFCLYACGTGFATSVTGDYDELHVTSPRTFTALEDLTSPLPIAISLLAGHPEIIRLYTPLAPSGLGTQDASIAISTFTSGPVEIEVVSPRPGWKLKVVTHSTATFRVTIAGITTPAVSIPAGAQSFSLPLHFGLNRLLLSSSLGSASVGPFSTSR
jgi:hypothetical protein